MRKFILGFIVGVAIMIPITAFGQTAYEKISAYVNHDIKVELEGELLNLDLAPIVYDQRTYLPVRELVEKVMGYEVEWVQETTTVVISSPDIWPIKDVTENSKINEGDNVREVKFQPEYYEIYNKDESLGEEEIKEILRRAKEYLDLHEGTVEKAAKYPENYRQTIIVDAYRDEIPKIREIIEYWETRLADLEETKSDQN